MGDSGRGGSPKSGKSAACLSRKRVKPKERPPRLQFRNLLCRISNRVLPATIRLKRRPRQVRSGQERQTKSPGPRRNVGGFFIGLNQQHRRGPLKELLRAACRPSP